MKVLAGIWVVLILGTIGTFLRPHSSIIGHGWLEVHELESQQKPEIVHTFGKYGVDGTVIFSTKKPVIHFDSSLPAGPNNQYAITFE